VYNHQPLTEIYIYIMKFSKTCDATVQGDSLNLHFYVKCVAFVMCIYLLFTPDVNVDCQVFIVDLYIGYCVMRSEPCEHAFESDDFLAKIVSK
jgi:hypothetical protein